MKKTQKCTKCNSKNIAGFAANPSFWYGNEKHINCIQIAPLAVIAKETYICTDCGYSEEWISDTSLQTAKEYQGSNKDLFEK